MKKSLIALAALATVATAAQAQSNVTIYGVVDMGYASVSGVAADYTKTTSASNSGTGTAAGYSGTDAGSATKTVRGLQNGGSGTSRWGMRGVEDLGQGLKANFTLEAEFLGDNGSTKSSAEALFNRESSVGLAGGFGAIKLGRYNSFSYAEGAKFDPFGGNNIGGYIAAGKYGYVRLENAVQYVSPSFNGVTVGVQSGTRTASASYPGTSITNYGEIAGKTGGNRNTAAMIAYASGALELSASYGEQKDDAGLKIDDVTTAFARYKFGDLRLVGGYMKQSADRWVATGTTSLALKTSTVKETTVTFIGGNYSITPNLTLNAIAMQIESEKVDGTVTKPQIYTAGLTYALSKRTSLYGVLSQSKQDNNSNQGIVSTSKFSYTDVAGNDVGGMPAVKGKDQTAYMIGVRHNF
jgi:predicted porin